MRLRNCQTGVVVDVSDATAARLGSEWQPERDKPAAPKTAPEKAAEKQATPRRRRQSTARATNEE
ncbi:DUF7302 family protein [Nocardia wallacei]|uniref:DUF7302 family protein n=1 Tax=Nocardia wallacei TaxID=480035 RepID=UPI00245745A4|nr:hypothetical protein [Nocardia wallacei]